MMNPEPRLPWGCWALEPVFGSLCGTTRIWTTAGPASLASRTKERLTRSSSDSASLCRASRQIAEGGGISSSAGAAVGNRIRRTKPKKRALSFRSIVGLRFRSLPALYRKHEAKTRAPLSLFFLEFGELLNRALVRPMCYLLGVTGLRDRVVLVTGASGGIGEAIAVEFARGGAVVVVSSRNEEKLQALAQRLKNNGGQALALCFDVADRKQVVALGAMIAGGVGTVQILINSAGVAPAASFLEMSDGAWDDVLRVNLTGTYNCCKTFLPPMINSGWGRIINIASTAAKVAYSHVSAYTTSKHGVLGLTRSLALETAKLGVTVNAICPGYVDTELTRENAQRMADKTGKSMDEILKLFSESSPQKRLIAPAEGAGLALMLASEKAGGITGQAINVDGGAVMA